MQTERPHWLRVDDVFAPSHDDSAVLSMRVLQSMPEVREDVWQVYIRDEWGAEKSTVTTEWLADKAFMKVWTRKQYANGASRR